MLAYVLEITKRGSNMIANRNRFQRLQIETRRITNRSNLRNFKLGGKDYKLMERL